MTIAFRGDVLDYGPNPVECLRWVAEHARFRVRGNHDNALGFDVDSCCMGSLREAALATLAWHKTLLDESDRRFLQGLPTLDWFEWEGRHFRMARATPQGDMYEYLSMNEWGERVCDLDEDFVLLGHTHIQGTRTFDGVAVVNPGSVGLARDGGGEACRAVVDGDRVKLKRIPYDVARVIDDLRWAPLPPTVVESLTRVLTMPRRAEVR